MLGDPVSDHYIFKDTKLAPDAKLIVQVWQCGRVITAHSRCTGIWASVLQHGLACTSTAPPPT